jgi:phage shock protein A
MFSLLVFVTLVVVALAVASIYAPALFKKVKVVANTARRGAENALSNPIEENKYDIEKSKSQLNTYKNQLSELIAANISLKHEAEDAQGEVDKFERLSIKAAKAGNREDAKEALSKKNLSASRVTMLLTEIQKNDTLISTIKDNIEVHENRIETAEIKTVQLETRLTNVELRDKMLATSVDTEGLAALDNLEREVEKREALAEAKGQVFTTTTLEQKYSDTDTEEELEALLREHSKV